MKSFLASLGPVSTAVDIVQHVSLITRSSGTVCPCAGEHQRQRRWCRCGLFILFIDPLNSLQFDYVYY